MIKLTPRFVDYDEDEASTLTGNATNFYMSTMKWINFFIPDVLASSS